MAPFIERALVYGRDEWDLAAVKRYLMERSAHLWAIVKDGEIDSVCVTYTIVYPRKRGLMMLTAAGRKPREWLKFEDQMRSWARQEGYDFMEAYARKGWTRILPHWKAVTTIIRRDL